MAGKWQLWYPHKIDAWQGSATIQTFSDPAYRAFHNLIMEQFQAPDGMLPDDDTQLARMSRLGARWEQVKHEVRPTLTANGAGRIYSRTQHELWQEANTRHDEYIGRMEKARANRWHKEQNNTQINPLINTQTKDKSVEDQTEKRKEKETRKRKNTCASDARAAEFRGVFQDSFQVQNEIPAPWDAKEATNLARFLKANPTITAEQWRRILFNRHNSPINHKASLSTWVARALAWLDAPADEWGKPLKTAPARVLPFQPVASAPDMTPRQQYEMWLSMSAAYKQVNPWRGEIPEEEKSK